MKGSQNEESEFDSELWRAASTEADKQWPPLGDSPAEQAFKHGLITIMILGFGFILLRQIGEVWTVTALTAVAAFVGWNDAKSRQRRNSEATRENYERLLRAKNRST